MEDQLWTSHEAYDPSLLPSATVQGVPFPQWLPPATLSSIFNSVDGGSSAMAMRLVRVQPYLRQRGP